MELRLLARVGLLSVVAGVIILIKPSDSLATLAVIAGIFPLVSSPTRRPGSFETTRAHS